jgi:hypothetical protein
LLPSDQTVIAVIECAIVLFTLAMACSDLLARLRRQEPPEDEHVVRDDESMTGLYAVYAVSVAVFELLADQAAVLEGHQVLFMITNYACLTYVFFFSSKFRNAIFFPLMLRVKRH